MALKNNPGCPCCGGMRGQVLYKVECGEIVKCPDCEAAYTSFSVRDIVETNKTFAESNFIKTRIYNQYNLRKAARSRLALLARFIKSGSILEFGSSTGEFLYESANVGYQVSSVDLHPQVLNINKTQNLKEIIVSSADSFAGKDTYDAIVAFHLVEHLTSPPKFLSICSTSLNPGGLLFLEVPNFGALSRILLGKRWGMFYDYHVCHFDKWSLEKMLCNNGYKVLLSRSVDEAARYINPIYSPVRNAIWKWLRRVEDVQGVSGEDRNDPSQGLTREGEELLLNSSKARIYRLETNLVKTVSKLFLPLSVILNMFCLGSYLQIIARKE